jgi:hypothetical protein
MEYWKTEIMGSNDKKKIKIMSFLPSIPIFHYSNIPWIVQHCMDKEYYRGE